MQRDSDENYIKLKYQLNETMCITQLTQCPEQIEGSKIKYSILLIQISLNMPTFLATLEILTMS